MPPRDHSSAHALPTKRPRRAVCMRIVTDMTARSFGTINPLPSGRYRARYLGPDGQRHSAPTTFDTKGDANAWLSLRHAEILTARWTPPAAPGENFGPYAARWVAERRLGLRTREHYERLLGGHLAAFADVPLRKITPAMVTTWHADLKAAPRARQTPRRLTVQPAPAGPRPLGATMKAHAYSLLRSILTTAADHDLIEANPCRIRGAGSTGKAAHKVRPASLEQLGAVIEAMPDQYRALVLVAAWGGLRFGEAAALRRVDVEPDGSVVHVRRGVVRVRGQRVEQGTKTEAGKRDVTMPPHLWPVLVGHLAEHVGRARTALLFPAADGLWLSPETLYRHWYRARDAAGLPDMHWHDLRHTGAVLAAQTGATIAELMGRLGHSTPAAALRYQHVAQGRDAIIAARLSALVEQ